MESCTRDTTIPSTEVCLAAVRSERTQQSGGGQQTVQKPRVCPCSNQAELCPGLPRQEHSQQTKGCDGCTQHLEHSHSTVPQSGITPFQRKRGTAQLQSV